MRRISIVTFICLLLSNAGPTSWAGNGNGKGKGGGGGGGGGGEPAADPAIAMVEAERQGHDLIVMNDDGSNQSIVLDGANLRHPDWSPDGSQVVFESNVDGLGIYVMDSDGANLTRLRAITLQGNSSAQNPTSIRPVWSPDTTADGTHKIAYLRQLQVDGVWQKLDVFLMDTDGSNEIHLIETSGAHERHVSWSPDARQLLVQRKDELLVYDIDLVDGVLTATESQNLTAAGALRPAVTAQVRYPAWAKTQDKIAVSVWLDGEDTFDVWVIDLNDPSNPERLTNAGDDSFHPTWSPDDSRIAFVRGPVWDGGKILSMAADGTDVQTLASSRKKKFSDPGWRR